MSDHDCAAFLAVDEADDVTPDAVWYHGHCRRCGRGLSAKFALVRTNDAPDLDRPQFDRRTQG